MYVEDDIVIEIVTAAIKKLEETSKDSWIVSGFPMTNVQAMSIQKMWIIPDKIFNIAADDYYLGEGLKKTYPTLIQSTEVALQYAEKALSTYNWYFKGLK